MLHKEQLDGLSVDHSVYRPIDNAKMRWSPCDADRDVKLELLWDVEPYSVNQSISKSISQSLRHKCKLAHECRVTCVAAKFVRRRSNGISGICTHTVETPSLDKWAAVTISCRCLTLCLRDNIHIYVNCETGLELYMFTPLSTILKYCAIWGIHR